MEMLNLCVQKSNMEMTEVGRKMAKTALFFRKDGLT